MQRPKLAMHTRPRMPSRIAHHSPYGGATHLGHTHTHTPTSMRTYLWVMRCRDRAVLNVYPAYGHCVLIAVLSPHSCMYHSCVSQHATVSSQHSLPAPHRQCRPRPITSWLAPYLSDRRDPSTQCLYRLEAASAQTKRHSLRLK